MLRSSARPLVLVCIWMAAPAAIGEQTAPGGAGEVRLIGDFAVAGPRSQEPAPPAAAPPLPEWPSTRGWAPQAQASRVLQTSHEEPVAAPPTIAAVPQPRPQNAAPAANDPRRLSPPKPSRPHEVSLMPGQSSSPFPFAIPRGSVPATLAALSLVVGLFLIAMWALKRGMPKSARLLPSEAVSVLGRIPLTAKQYAHLLHVGDKLVLVSITPAGTDTLTEVTDRDEVTRLVALCAQQTPHSVTRDFEQVFQQMAREPAPRGFLDQGSYAATSRGGRSRA